MELTLNYIVESTLILVTLYSVYCILLKSEKCFRFNRYYLLLVPVFAFTMPLISIPLTQGNPLYLGEIMLPDVSVLNISTENSTELWNWWNIIQGTYLLLMLFFFFKSLNKVIKIQLLKTSGLLEKHRGFNLIRTTSIDQNIFTFFKDVFVPKDHKIVDEIIAHEKVHARELHTFDVLFYEFLTVVFWFNPLIYMLRLAVEINHEFLADYRVSKQNKNYVGILANYHIKTIEFSLGSAFSKPNIIERIEMIHNKNNKTMKVKFFTPVLALLSLFVLFCCEGQNDDHSLLNNSSELTLDSEAIYDQVDNHPMPEGGMTTYFEWIGQSIKYPEVARKEGLEGKVFIQFIIDKNGNFRETSIIKGASPSLNKEALRVVSSSKPWTAGIHKGKAVNTRMILPIVFKLPKKS